MATEMSPYLGFRDNAREAMTFYQSVLGGELAVSTFSDFGMGEGAEGDLVMHSQLDTPNGMVLMGSDSPSSMGMQPPGGPQQVAIFGDDLTELQGYWDGLSEGGTVTAPFEKAPWGDVFGMCIDRFGVLWMLNVAAGEQG